ncbi:MAG: glycosyltransferase family 39 protein [Acidobacteriota bacterium]|nr:glycosyltransferase family 39 protein [Acidobacteriota bacterium]
MPEIPHAHAPALSSRITNVIAVALLVLFATLLITSSRQESQTFDESVHLLAGFEYWKHGDFGRNPEHPPLAKLLAAAPLLSMNLKDPPVLPIPYFKGQDMINGGQFLYSSNADAILQRGRFVIVLLSLTLALLVFFAAREMFGPPAALLALGLFVFEPSLIAHGALVTTDMPLACLFFASIYAFYRFAQRPTFARLALTATASSLTIITKHSGVLLFPVLVLLALTEIFTGEKRREPAKNRTPLVRYALALLLIAAVSYAALWAIYGFRYAARPGHLQIVPALASFAAGIPHPWQRSLIASLAAHRLLPEAYLYGWADILQISSTRYSYLFGRLYSAGHWFFFPAVFVIKTTLTLLALLVLVPFARLHGRTREFRFLLVPPLFFFLFAVASMVNLGIRHLLPIYPFCIVLAGAAAAAFAVRSTATRVAIAALLLFTVVSSLHAYPDFLAYSNEAFGGPAHTYRVLTDSNADWGQGLKWTRTYLDQHPAGPNSADDCWMNYANPIVNTSYYGIRCKPLIDGLGHWIGMGTSPIPSKITGTVLLSSTDAAGLMWGPDTLNPYQDFLNRRPDDVIGNVILVYRGSFAVPLLAAQTNATAATMMLRQHRFPEALALAQAAVAQAPQSAEVNAVLGQVLFASGRMQEGQQAIANAIRLAKSDHPEYQKFLLSMLERH